jgi:hypothetical protein
MGGNATTRLLALCRELGMPAAFLEQTGQRAAEAKAIHFGFEENESTQLYKLYLEVDIASEESTTEPRLLHVGLKWDIQDPRRRAVTEYMLYPGISAPLIAARLASVYRSDGTGEGLPIATDLLGLAVSRISAEELQYLEVSEGGNPRSSFDLNAYDAGLNLRDLYPLLVRMCQLHSVGAEPFATLYEQIEDCSFGHLAGGVHRDGEAFSTVYYGVEWHEPPEQPS